MVFAEIAFGEAIELFIHCKVVSGGAHMNGKQNSSQFYVNSYDLHYASLF